MNFYVQYQNADKRGVPPFAVNPCETVLSIQTSVSDVCQACGQVFLIVGIGKPKRYYLWETFVINEVQRVEPPGAKSYFEARGPGWQLMQPQLLNGPVFNDFRRFCANFIGFRRIDSHPFASELHRLAQTFRPNDLSTIVANNNDDKPTSNASVDPLILPEQYALSIRQPHVEAILRGIKTVEYRRRGTQRRGDIYIYSSHRRYALDEEKKWLRKYRMSDVAPEELPRGVIVGMVELYDSHGGDWYLRSPQRFAEHLRPRNKPQPVFFRPFLST